MKICLPSLVIREIQIKTLVRYHLTPVRMAIIKKDKGNKQTNVGIRYGEEEPLFTVGEILNWYSYYEKQYGDFSKN